MSAAAFATETFAPIWHRRTYAAALYLLLGLPLGIVRRDDRARHPPPRRAPAPGRERLDEARWLRRMPAVGHGKPAVTSRPSLERSR